VAVSALLLTVLTLELKSLYCTTYGPPTTGIIQQLANKDQKIKYQQKFSLPIKGLVNTSRTLGKPQIKMQLNFYLEVAKLSCSENVIFCSIVVVDC